MSYMDVMYGNLGQVNNQLQGNLAQNAAMNQGQQLAMQQQQQAAAAQQAQLAALYGSGGFGAQTDYYSALGAQYGRNTGYYGDTLGLTPGQTTPAAQAANPWLGYNFDNSQYLSGLGYYSQPGTVGSDWGGGGAGGVGNDWPTYPGAGGRDFSYPAPQPQAQLDLSPYFNQLTAPQSPYNNNSGALGGYPDWYSIASGGGGGGGYYGQAGSVGNDWGGLGSIPAAAPNPYATLGYDPSTLYQNAMSYPGGGVSSFFNPASYGGFGMGIPAAAPYQQQSAVPDWMSIASGSSGAGYYAQPGNVANDWATGGLMAGDQSWLGAGGTQNPYNPFGQINSGQLGGADAFYGYPAGQPSGMGGIGSDTSRDPYAWLYAQSSPYASSLGVPGSPTANLGYNPGMANYFANPGMQSSGVDTSQSAVNAATGQMRGLLDWYNQLMFDPNFRQVGSDVPPLPGGGGSVDNDYGRGSIYAR